MDIIGTVRTLLTSAEVISIMDRGTGAVLDKIAESLDGYLAVQIPAYGAAKQACASVPGCTERLVTIRNDLFRDFAAATGIYAIVATAVRIYTALPSTVRAVVADASQVVGAAVDIVTSVSDLDLNKSVAALANGTSFVAESPIRAIEYGRDARTLVSAMFTRYFGDLFATIEDVPVLGDIYRGAADLVGVVGSVTGVVEDVVEDVVGGVVEVGGDVISGIGDVLGL